MLFRGLTKRKPEAALLCNKSKLKKIIATLRAVNAYSTLRTLRFDNMGGSDLLFDLKYSSI